MFNLLDTGDLDLISGIFSSFWTRQIDANAEGIPGNRSIDSDK
jgi:hypothetical protein